MKATYALRIDARVRDKVRAFCTAHGIKQGFFVEQALREHLEQEDLTDDLKDFKRLRSQEALAIELTDYVARRRG